MPGRSLRGRIPVRLIAFFPKPHRRAVGEGVFANKTTVNLKNGNTFMNRTSPLHLLLPRFAQRTLCGTMLLMLCALVSVSCGKQQPDPYVAQQETIWKYGPSEIVLNVKSSQDLNLYRNKSHTLAVCAYQLSGDRGFNELVRSDAGLEQLVQCGRFDESVIHYEQAFFPPGSSRTLTLDRREGVKHFALVAGYYEPGQGSKYHLARIPLVEVSDSWVPLVGATRKEAGKLFLDVNLDNTSMYAVESKRQAQ